MDPEQTASADSEADILTRLAAIPDGEPEAAPEEAAVEETPPEETPEPTPEVEEPDDSFEWTADDGEVVKLPAKAREAVLRQADYTRKTMEVATVRQQAEDRMLFVQAREKLSTEVFQEVVEARSIQSELERYRQADWATLYNENPGQALQLQQKQRDLERQLGEKQAAIQRKAQEIEQATKGHADRQWQLAEQAAIQRIGKVSKEDNEAMGRAIQALGFDPKEFKERFADPRVIHAVYKAAKYDALQASKPAALNSVKTAPPVVKPGASKGPGVAAEQKYRDTRQSLKKSGSLQDAARLLMNLE